MLDFFRQRGLSNIIYGAVIVATILAFVITFRPNATSKTASLTEACAARVRGRCIDPKDFASAYRILMPSRSGSLSRKLNIKRVALDGLIERELLDDEAKRLGISATDAEVTDQLYAGYVRVSIPAADPAMAQAVAQEMYQTYARTGLVSQDVALAHFNDRDGAIPVDFRDPKTKLFDMKTYERQVRNLSNRSTTEFREEQARELLAAKMRDVVREPVRISEIEAWQQYERQYSTATVSHVTVKEAWAARWAVGGGASEVEAWVKSHPSDTQSALDDRVKQDMPKAGHIRHILVTLQQGATDDEKGLALAKLSWAASRIRAGESFAEVARDTSGDTASAAQGGDVGDKTDGFVAPFKAAAEALKPGEMTPHAVETQFGYHLIERDDPVKTAEVEAQIKRDASRDLYARALATGAARSIAQKILDDMRSGKSDEQAIETAIAPFKRDMKVPLLKLSTAPSAPAAGGPNAGGARAADAAISDKGSFATLPEKRFDATTDPARPQPQSSSGFNRGGDPLPGLSPEGTARIIAFAFTGKDGDVMSEPMRTTDGFALVQLKEHKLATREEFDRDKLSFQEQLLRAKRDEALSLYVKRLREQAKGDIRVDSSYVQESRVDGGAPNLPDDEDEY